MKNYQPTKQLPRERGVPYTRDEIIHFMATLDERRHGFGEILNPLPPQQSKLPIVTRSLITANWVKSNIARFAVSLAQP